MDKNNKETRNKIKDISDIKTFENLLNMSTLTEEQKQIIRMFYLEEKSINYIADILGMSAKTVSNKHRKALMKLGKLF